MLGLATSRGRLAPNEGFAVLLQLSGVLAEYHAADPACAHGDVCASTTVLTPGGDVRLVELGLAQALGQGPSGPPRAEAHSLAPEQLAGNAGAPADVLRECLAPEDEVRDFVVLAAAVSDSGRSSAGLAFPRRVRLPAPSR